MPSIEALPSFFLWNQHYSILCHYHRHTSPKDSHTQRELAILTTGMQAGFMTQLDAQEFKIKPMQNTLK